MPWEIQVRDTIPSTFNCNGEQVIGDFNIANGLMSFLPGWVLNLPGNLMMSILRHLSNTSPPLTLQKPSLSVEWQRNWCSNFLGECKVNAAKVPMVFQPNSSNLSSPTSWAHLHIALIIAFSKPLLQPSFVQLVWYQFINLGKETITLDICEITDVISLMYKKSQVGLLVHNPQKVHIYEMSAGNCMYKYSNSVLWTNLFWHPLFVR